MAGFLTSVVREAQRRSRGGANFIPTEPGDPDFSFTQEPSSQAQFPAAAAEKRLFESQTRAQNVLQELSPEADPNVRRDIEEMARTGTMPRKKTLGEDLLGWVSGPFQFTNLLVQSIVTQGGNDTVTLGDYWDAFWGGIEDPHGFQLRTGLQPWTMDHTLDLFGWEEPTNTTDRVFRGIAGFGFSLMIDPLTYITGGLSGLGRKVAGARARQAQEQITTSVMQALRSGNTRNLTRYERHLVNSVEDTTNTFLDTVQQRMAQNNGVMPVDLAKSMERQLGHALPPGTPIPALGDEFVALAVRSRIADDLVAPVLARDFARLNPLVREHVPKYLYGGIRISFPFSKAGLEKGFYVPGTAGLGKKIVGDPLREISKKLKDFSPKYNRLANTINKKWQGAFDIDEPLLRAVGRGEMTGWEYHHALVGIDRVYNRGAVDSFRNQINVTGRLLAASAKTHNFDPDDIFRLVSARMQNVDDVASGRAAMNLPDNLNRQVDQAASELREIFDVYHKKLSEYIDLKYVDDYMPLTVTPDGAGIMHELAMTQTGIPEAVWSSAQASGDIGPALYVRTVQALGKHGRIEAPIGSTAHMDQRTLGFMHSLGFGNAVLADNGWLGVLGEASQNVLQRGALDPSQVRPAFLSHADINKALAPIIRAEAKKQGITIPRGWDGRVFNENPFQVAIDYIGSLDDAVAMWGAVDAFQSAGLVYRMFTPEDIGDIVTNVINNMVRNAAKVPAAHHAPLKAGQAVPAPRKWIENILDTTQANRLQEATLKGNVLEGSADTVLLNIDDAGVWTVVDGLEALRNAANRGISEMPAVKVVPGNIANPVDTDTLISGLRLFSDNPRNISRNMERLARGDRIPVENELRQAEAVAQWYHTRKQPTENLFRGMPLSKAPVVGDTIDIGMGNATRSRLEAGRFAGDAADQMNVLRQQVPLEEGGWIVSFDAATPAALNVENSNVAVVSGRYRINSIDQANRVVEVSFVEDILPNPQPRINVEQAWDNAVEIGDVADAVPWQPTVLGQEKYVLAGSDALLRGPVPARVIGALKRAGFDHTDPTDARQLLEFAALDNTYLQALRGASGTEGTIGPGARAAGQPSGTLGGPQTSTFESLRVLDKRLGSAGRAGWDTVQLSEDVSVHTLRTASGDPAADIVVRKVGNLHEVDFALSPNLSEREILGFTDQLVDRFAEVASEIPGLTSHKNVERLLREGVSEEGARVLQRYVQRQIRGLPDDVKEYIYNLPAEYVDTVTMYREFEETFNAFLRMVTGRRGPDGKLLPTSPRILGDETFRNMLGDLKKSAGMLEEQGYDFAVKIFNNVDDFTAITGEGMVNPAIFALGGPALEGVQVHPAIGMWLRNVARNMATIYTPEGIAAFKLAGNNVLRWWKAMATVARPNFHIRNAYSQGWMNMLMGVQSKHYAQTTGASIRLRHLLTRKNNPLTFPEAINTLPPNTRQMFADAWEDGIFKGFAVTEFRQYSMKELGGRMAWAKVWDLDNFALTRMGAKGMETVEDVTRMALYAAWYDPKNPASRAVARDMVNAIHFDYVNLTPLETKLKSFIPFFVWIRRNLPRQVQMLVENPRTIRRWQHAMAAIEDNFDSEKSGLPTAEFFNATAAGTDYFVNPNTPFWARIVVDPDVPHTDLLDIPYPNDIGQVVDWFRQQFGPHIGLPVDLIEQRDFRDVNAPAPFNAVLQSLAAVGLYDETLQGDVRIPYLMRTIMETGFPPGREVIDPLTGGPTDPVRQGRLGIQPDDDLATRTLKSVGWTLARGAGIKLSSPNDARSAAGRSQAQLRDLVEDLRLKGLLPPSGS